MANPLNKLSEPSDQGKPARFIKITDSKMTPKNTLANLSVLAAFVTLLLTAQNGLAQEKIDFAKSIQPIFEGHCASCHGDDKDEAPIQEYIEPGESVDDSEIYNVITSDDEDQLMPPPDEENPLSADQISLIKTWVEQGSQWPEGVELVDRTEEAKAAKAKSDAAEPTGNDDETENKKEQPTVDPDTQLIYDSAGSLHPAVLHLPLGLLLGAGLFAFLSLRGNFVMSDCAYYCLWLGAWGGLLACVTGWFFSPMEHRGAVNAWSDLLDMEQPIFWHRTGALVCTAFAFLVGMFAASSRVRDPDNGLMWKLSVIALAAGIGWVGHTGGELSWPSDHYESVNKLWNKIINPDAVDQPQSASEKDSGAKEPDSEKAANTETEKSDATPKPVAAEAETSKPLPTPENADG